MSIYPYHLGHQVNIGLKATVAVSNHHSHWFGLWGTSLFFFPKYMQTEAGDQNQTSISPGHSPRTTLGSVNLV